MQSIETSDSVIHFNAKCYKALNTYLKEANNSKIFILVDENTHELCLPRFLSLLETEINIEILEIESGEQNKNIDTCSSLWEALSELGADRKSLLINLGGGVITDLGGFVASTFKRGINYINVPTTLLAMVDASVGGKTGVDLGNLKNQIGVINAGDMVLVDTVFLETLPEDQLYSGMAEMLKHGLISNYEYWKDMFEYIYFKNSTLGKLIYDSIVIKNNVVTQDPNEQNLRKTLNFGHTLGHAIESYFLENPSKKDLLHGEAVAVGMILECYISQKMLAFPENKLSDVVKIITTIYSPIFIENLDFNPIIELLKYDKKNEHGNINFVLLKDIGIHEIDCQVDNKLIIESFNYYNEVTKSL